MPTFSSSCSIPAIIFCGPRSMSGLLPFSGSPCFAFTANCFAEGKASSRAFCWPRSASGLLPFSGNPCFAFAATYFWAKAAKSKQKPLFRSWLLMPDQRACRRLSLPDRKPVTQARSGCASSPETGSKVRYQLPLFVKGDWRSSGCRRERQVVVLLFGRAPRPVYYLFPVIHFSPLRRLTFGPKRPKVSKNRFFGAGS